MNPEKDHAMKIEEPTSAKRTAKNASAMKWCKLGVQKLVPMEKANASAI